MIVHQDGEMEDVEHNWEKFERTIKETADDVIGKISQK